MIDAMETEVALASLYEADETAWLEAMADLIGRKAYTELDYPHLQEYLTDMALRERREVESRLNILLTHLLKWVHQPERRSASWQTTILDQSRELVLLTQGGVLRNHAEAVLSNAFAKAVRRAAIETKLKAEEFPSACPYTLDEALAFDPIMD